jgi:hypothetical protein
MPRGRNPKYNYRSEEFLLRVENLAKKGLTDGEIACSIGMGTTYFCEKKKELSELSEVLARARSGVNAVVRQRYLSVGLGGIKTKSLTRRKIEIAKGEFIDGEVIQETETELAPNPQVLQNWLFHHDREWNERVMAGKRLDVTSNGGDINGTQLVFSPTPLSAKDIEEIKKWQIGKEDSVDAGISET